MMDNELKGKIVMMRPEMWEEVADAAGVIGEIIQADITKDDIYVNYGSSWNHLHSADAVLILKSPDEIRTFLDTAVHNLSAKDVQDLENIALLQEYGSKLSARKAMEIVQRNEKIRDAGTDVLFKHIIAQLQNTGPKR